MGTYQTWNQSYQIWVMVLTRMEGKVEELEQTYCNLTEKIATIDVPMEGLLEKITNSKAHTSA